MKLNDTQLILLSTASQRENGSLFPLPDNLSVSGDKARKAIASMLKANLCVEGETQSVALAWRQDDETHYGVRITDAGRQAIGADEAPHSAVKNGEAANPTPSTPTQAAPRITKASTVLAMLQRPEGATLDELVAATGWLPHTTRAALTGLRKKGHQIDKGKRGDETCYSVAAKA